MRFNLISSVLSQCCWKLFKILYSWGAYVFDIFVFSIVFFILQILYAHFLNKLTNRCYKKKKKGTNTVFRLQAQVKATLPHPPYLPAPHSSLLASVIPFSLTHCQKSSDVFPLFPSLAKTPKSSDPWFKNKFIFNNQTSYSLNTPIRTYCLRKSDLENEQA